MTVTDASSKGKGLWGAMAIPGALLLAVLFVIPLLLLIVFSFGTTNIIGQPQIGASLENYALVFRDYNLAIFLRTLLYSAAATVLCLLLAYPYAYFVVRFAKKYAPALIAAVILPWLVDYLVRIYAWRQVLGEEGLLNSGLNALGLPGVSWIGTPFSVIIGLTYSYLPLMVLPLYAALNDFDMSLIEAGKDLYGGPVATFWRVTLPSTSAGIAGGIILVFLPMLGDFATAQFLGGANTTMLGNIIADQFTQSGSVTFGAALAVSMVIILTAVLASVMLFLRKRKSLTSLVGG